MEFLDVPLFDDDIFKLLVRFAIDLVALSLIVVFAIYPGQREREFVFTAVMLNVIVFFICFTMKKLELDLGLALGLFAVFGVLRFLALDVALVNSDGYWTRASDYSLFLDRDKRFHAIPHDMNEAFHSGRGPGGPRRGPGGFGPRESGRDVQRPDNRDAGAREVGAGRGREADREQQGATDRPQNARPRQEAPPRLPDERGQRDRRPGGFRPEEAGRGGFEPRGQRRGFGGPGGAGHGGVDLDPLVSIDKPRMPLRSRLLAVPGLPAKYLQYVRAIAEKSLDWKQIEPVVAQHGKLI